MDLLNRALEQVIDQLVTQKISNLKLEIENQKQTILGMVLMSGPYNYKMGRVVQTKAILLLKSMSERVGTDITRL